MIVKQASVSERGGSSQLDWDRRTTILLVLTGSIECRLKTGHMLKAVTHLDCGRATVVTSGFMWTQASHSAALGFLSVGSKVFSFFFNSKLVYFELVIVFVISGGGGLPFTQHSKFLHM